jgi:hypothetical protein
MLRICKSHMVRYALLTCQELCEASSVLWPRHLMLGHEALLWNGRDFHCFPFSLLASERIVRCRMRACWYQTIAFCMQATSLNWQRLHSDRFD